MSGKNSSRSLIPKPAFKEIPTEIRKSTWVRPKLVCEVRFGEWTSAQTVAGADLSRIKGRHRREQIARSKTPFPEKRVGSLPKPSPAWN